MTLRSATATATLFLSAVFATAQQVPQFTDPANLRGERVKPRDGRELPIDQGARGLEQMLRKLNTRASLMLIVAHPDDEDGGMLTYYSRGLGARVAMLTLTRGEGGQNAMTGDFEDALGLLRTQELLSADRYLGVDQFFGTEVDFGFSKTKEEAFKKWTHERVLYDAVRAIRLYRPLVIAAVFIGGVTDGHGQHQVSGQIAQEAFKAAADPTVFPDMIAEGILPWQALKVYARVPMQSISDKGLFDYATGKYTAPRFENYVTGEVTTTTPTADVIVHEGTPDKLLSDDPAAPPRTYVQFARIGLGMQKSQIGGGIRVPPAGAFDVSYHRYGSKLANQPQHETSFFDGIDTSIGGIGRSIPGAPKFELEQLESLEAEMKQLSDRNASEKQRPRLPELLAGALKRTDLILSTLESSQLTGQEKADALHELRIKRVQLNDALALALGAQVDAEADGADVLQNGLGLVHVQVSESADLRLKFPVRLSAFGTKAFTELRREFGPDDPQRSIEAKVDLHFRPDMTSVITKPYFFRDNIEEASYQMHDAALRNAPSTPPAFVAKAHYTYNGVDFEIDRIVHNGLQPVSIVPHGSLSLSTHAQVLLNSATSTTIRAFLTPATTPAIAPTLALPTGWRSTAASANAATADETRFTITPPPTARRATLIKASAALPDGTISVGYRPIGYGDLPRTNYYTPATVRIVPVDLNLPSNKKIAYLPGTGDAVPEALASINLKPEILTVADLTPAKLAQYDTVILGVRTYAAHPDLHGAPTQALLDYARNGGNVLLQYQTTEFTATDAPYPLDLGSNERVVDETDPVQLLDSSAPFLTTPNKITPADFNNWVEERGHGFLSTWDSHYTALTETHDPEEDPQRGGLITAALGKGRWTYCAFALYRQLPEAVPGAFRLFVNLISPATAKN
jgi:LmbE family N-acetylglucosaminyl deacetylase